MLTHIVRHIVRMARPTNFNIGVRMEDDDPHRPQAPWPPRSKVKVTRSHDQSDRVGPMVHQSKTNSRSITKIGSKYPITRATLRTNFNVKRSKVRVTGRLTQTHKMCHIFRTVRPKNFKVGVQMSSILFHWMDDIDPHQRQAPWPLRLKIKVISSHYRYVSSLPFLNSGNKMLYLCY